MIPILEKILKDNGESVEHVSTLIIYLIIY